MSSGPTFSESRPDLCTQCRSSVVVRLCSHLSDDLSASLLVCRSRSARRCSSTYLPIEILLDWKAAARTDENARSKSLARPNLTSPPWPNVLPLGDDRRCCFVAPALVLVARALFCRPPSFFRRRGGQKTQKSPSCGTSVSFVRARAAHGEKNNVSPGSVRMTTLASADVRFPRETEQWRRGRAARWWTVSSPVLAHFFRLDCGKTDRVRGRGCIQRRRWRPVSLHSHVCRQTVLGPVLPRPSAPLACCLLLGTCRCPLNF